MELADFTLSECDDPYVGKAQPLVDTGDIFLIPTDAVQSFGIDEIELVLGNVCHQGLDAGSGEGCP